ncbi:MAG: hypothetical protein GY719_31080 [bacterium]|nr:hypothetical protein [bacterium]
MTKRIRIGVDDKIPVPFTFKERDLILAETFIDMSMDQAFRVAEVKGGRVVVPLTLSDIEDLMGHVAATANHTDDRQLERKLYAIWERLDKCENRYEDELSAPPGGWKS